MRNADTYKSLDVWNDAMLLTEIVYDLIKKLPEEEDRGLSDQMRRAAVSIASNIAEGEARNPNEPGKFAWYLSVASGSRSELETQLQICVRVKYFTDSDISTAMDLLRKIGLGIKSLISKNKTDK